MKKACLLLVGLVTLSIGLRGFSQEPKAIEGSLTADKTPTPEPNAVKAARKKVRNTFAADFKAAKDPQAKLTLAKELAQKAKDSKDDPESEYALAMEASDLFISEGDALSTFGLVDDLALTFDIPVIETKAALFKRATKEAKAPAQKRIAALVGLKLAGEAASAEAYDVAQDLATVSLAQARPLRDPSVVKRATDHQAKYAEASKVWMTVVDARTKLKSDPNDADANDVVGRYLCFVRQDWKQGLLHLKECNDQEVKAVAGHDLSISGKEENPTGDAKTLADAWWDIAVRRKKERTQILPRCAFWLEKAVPMMTGSAKADAEKRLLTIYEAVTGRSFAKILSEPPNGVLVAAVVNCADDMVPVTLQPSFDSQRSWLLSLQVYTTEFPGGPHMVFSWADGRPGRDMLMLGWNGPSYGISIEDCINGTGQAMQYTTTPDQLSRWIDTKVVHDAVAQELEFYVDNRLIRREPLTITPRVDKPMPIYLGGSDGAGYRFTGQVRNVWFGNIR